MTSKQTGAARAAKRVRPMPVIAVLAIAVMAYYGIRYWRFEATHVATDDAYVTGNVITVSPQASGTVKRVLVKDNQEVKAGDLLVVLDDATYRSAVEQAEANLQAAIAQARAAGVSVTLASATGSAQEMQAEGVVSQAGSAINGAKEDVGRAEAAILVASSGVSSAKSNVSAVRAAVASALAAREKAVAAVSAAEAGTLNAQAVMHAARAAVDAAQANCDKAVRDTRRYTALAADGAVAQQIADNAVTAESAARAQLDAAREQASAAQAGVAARQAETNAARQQVKAADAAVMQAKAQLAAAGSQAVAAQSGVAMSRAQRDAAVSMIAQAAAKRDQAMGQLNLARTTTHQVAISKAGETTALAKIAQARAALHAAQINLGYTRIYAAVSGRVNKKTVEEGALVAAGTPLLAIVPSENVWVVANLKETQLRKVEPGRHAEIEVDAISGRTFKGHVDSLASATGATFALLPADNASGNFTKVVQRVPVKIVLEPGQANLDRLRSGMSVMATVETD